MKKKIGSRIIDVSGGRVTARKHFARDSLTVMFVWKYLHEPNAKRLYENIKSASDVRKLDTSIRKSEAFFGKKTWK